MDNCYCKDYFFKFVCVENIAMCSRENQNQLRVQNSETKTTLTKTQSAKAECDTKNHHLRKASTHTSADPWRLLASGWGYVVITCSFLVTALTLGFKTSLGVFYVEWEYYFAVTKTEVSWVTSMSPLVIGITSK